MMGHWLSPEGLLERARSFHDMGEDICIATLIEVRGSAPQDLGAKILIPRHQAPIGTIGGGKFEAAVIAKAREMLAVRNGDKLKVFTCNLQRDLGMSCGGEAKVLLEPVFAAPSLTVAVFGAGHVAQALIPLLAKLRVTVYWLDDRQEWLDKGPSEGPRLIKIKVDFSDRLSEVMQTFPSSTFIVSVTKGHQNDVEVLKVALRQGNFPFIGVIGSHTKSKSLRRQLLVEGFNENQVGSFFCPIGEPFGTNDPTEIAFSIIAQILKVRDQYQANAGPSPRE